MTPRHRPKFVKIAEAHPDRDDSLAQFVRQHRKAAGLTQRELAELASVGARAVWDLERGKATLRMDIASAVLRVFGRALGIVEARRKSDFS